MTMTDDTPSLQALFRASEHRQDLCVLALLTWVASSDGTLAGDELAMLRSVANRVEGGGAGAVLPAVIEVARRGRTEDIEFACRYVRNHASRAEKPSRRSLRKFRSRISCRRHRCSTPSANRHDKRWPVISPKAA